MGEHTVCMLFQFEAPTVFTALDKTPPGVAVGHATACDPDSEGNNFIEYELFTGNAYCMLCCGVHCCVLYDELYCMLCCTMHYIVLYVVKVRYVVF